jgi:hypothetical protein
MTFSRYLCMKSVALCRRTLHTVTTWDSTMFTSLFCLQTTVCVSNAYFWLISCSCGCRCLDIPFDIRCKRRMGAPLVLTQGPREPKKLGPYLEGPLLAFRELGPHVPEHGELKKYREDMGLGPSGEKDQTPTAHPIISCCEVWLRCCHMYCTACSCTVQQHSTNRQVQLHGARL